MAKKNTGFTSRLNNKIKEKGISNPKFCKKIGIGYSTFMNYFNSDNYGRVPEWEQLLKISKGLDVSIEWLLTGDEPEKESKKTDTLSKLSESLFDTVEILRAEKKELLNKIEHLKKQLDERKSQNRDIRNEERKHNQC